MYTDNDCPTCGARFKFPKNAGAAPVTCRTNGVKIRKHKDGCKYYKSIRAGGALA